MQQRELNTVVKILIRVRTRRRRRNKGTLQHEKTVSAKLAQNPKC